MEYEYEEYRVLKNYLNEIIKISKQSYYKKYFTNNSNNLKKKWSGIKEIINIKSKNYEVPKKLCNPFNDYFTIADDILNKRKDEGNKSFQDFL